MNDKMSDELKPCPFCGRNDITMSPYTEKISHSTFVKCEHCKTAWTPVDVFNTRPIEDALIARPESDHLALVGDLAARDAELVQAKIHITELMDAQHEEVNQFNMGHDAFFAGEPSDAAPYFDVDYDVWLCGWAWAKFLREESTLKPAAPKESE